MTPEEKIEALREWANRPIDYDSDSPRFLDGLAFAKERVRDIIDPPKPKWRQKVDEWALVVSAVQKGYEWAGVVSTNSTLADVLGTLSGIARSGPSVSERATGDRLAQIVAICEKRVDDGWQADPDSNAYGCAEQDEYDVFHLLDPLANLTEPLCWKRVGDRAAAWLRSLTDEKPGTRTDAKYEHTLGPHCPVCFGVCAGSNRDGAA